MVYRSPDDEGPRETLCELCLNSKRCPVCDCIWCTEHGEFVEPREQDEDCNDYL